MSATALNKPSLSSFNPHAVHYFTSVSSGPTTISPSTQVGVPTAAYPSHILVASTSPSRAQPPKNSSVPSQTTPLPLSTQSSPVPMQSPQPRTVVTKGFALGLQVTPAAIKGHKTGRSKQGAIFEPFHYPHNRPVTPELDAVLKKRNVASWCQSELLESLKSS